MRLKLPLTEKFLWDLYNLSKGIGELLDSCVSDRWYGFKGIEEIIWPDIYTFKDKWVEQQKQERLKKKARKDFAKLVYRLKQNGYIKKLKIKDKAAVMLTPKGLNRVFTIKMKVKNKKRRVDKKWQMVLFDIPEEKRRKRDLFRKALKYLGYQKLQKSIWVCPYDVLKETRTLIKRYKLEPYVELLLVKKIGFG